MVKVFAIPALLAAAGFVGLLVALLGDGTHDAFGWVTVGLPLAVLPWAWWRAGRLARGPHPPR